MEGVALDRYWLRASISEAGHITITVGGGPHLREGAFVRVPLGVPGWRLWSETSELISTSRWGL
jgi:hypothetical protein